MLVECPFANVKSLISTSEFDERWNIRPLVLRAELENPSVKPAPSIVNPVTPESENTLDVLPAASRVMSFPSTMSVSLAIASLSSDSVYTVVLDCRVGASVNVGWEVRNGVGESVPPQR